jgi:hypothetical protein
MPSNTACCAVDTGGRKLKTWPYTNNYAHLTTGASVHMPQTTFDGRFHEGRCTHVMPSPSVTCVCVGGGGWGGGCGCGCVGVGVGVGGSR